MTTDIRLNAPEYVPAGEARVAEATLNGAGKLFFSSGTGYEGSAACKMVATRCAFCGRPLVDAVSVETGVGPDCRGRHGRADAAGPVNEPELRTQLEAAVALQSELAEVRDAVLASLATAGDHRAANVLVHRIAIYQVGPAVAHLTAALAALGYAGMAQRIGQRLGHVEVTREGEFLVAHLPYDPSLIEGVRRIPGRRLEKRRNAGGKREITVNIFPVAQASALWAALQSRLPAGTLVLGAKGYRVIPSRRGS